MTEGKRLEETKVPCPDDSPPVDGQLTDDLEQDFFDEIAAESMELFGVDAKLFKLRSEQSDMDIVYNEPGNAIFTPHDLKVFFEYDNARAVDAGEAGQTITYATRCWFSRRLLEDLKIDPPVEGDVIGVWNLFWDLTLVDAVGHFSDQPTFESYVATISRNEKFAPERRIGEVLVKGITPFTRA